MQKLDLREIFESFNRLKVLILGDVMIDSYMWGKVDRISPEAPIPIVACNKKENRLGGAANVALNIQALGATPILCSVIGNKEYGQQFYDLMKKQNFFSEGILFDEDRVTTMKTRIISNNQHLLRVDEENDNPLSEKMETQLVNKVKQIISKENIDIVVIQDYDKGVVTPTVLDNIIKSCNELKIPVLADPKKRNFLNYKDITLFKPNFKEFTEGLKTDINIKDSKSLFEESKKFQSRSNIKYVLITLSSLGIFICDNNTYKTIPAQVRDVADVSGAGDTVLSSAAVCLAAGMPAEDIAIVSNIAGGQVCEKVGVVPVDKDQLLKECLSLYGE